MVNQLKDFIPKGWGAQKKITQAIADACGVHYVTAWRWMSGTASVKQIYRGRIAEVLKTDVKKIFPS